MEKDYGDLMLFHLVIAMLSGEGRAKREGKNLSESQKAAETVWVESVCSENLTMAGIACVCSSVKSVFWKLLSFTLVLFLRIHAYGFLSAILVFMSRLGIDSL